MRITLKVLWLSILMCPLLGIAQLDSIKVLSWNVFLRPAILHDHQLERVQGISEYLIASKADVIILQEVFHRKARKQLTEALQKSYPYQTKKGPVSFWGVSSGVALYSKFPFLKEKKISFKESMGADKLAKKGVVVSLVKIKSKEVYIVGTHLQSGSSEKFRKIRKNQMKTLANSIKNIDSSKVVLYAGDFNFTPDAELFSSLDDVLGVSIPKLDSSILATANFTDQELFPAIGKPVWIDFIFLRKTQLAKQSRTWIEEPRFKFKGKKRRISDHNPIISVFEINEINY